MTGKKEEYIELEIHAWLMEQGVYSWSNLMRGFYDEKAGKYRSNKNNFYRNGISDISCLIDGKFVCIEVKRPSEMSFFDRPIGELNQRFIEAQCRNLGKQKLKKYRHAVEQREFLDNIIKEGGVGFFSSSVKQTIERLEENGFIIS